MAASINTSSLTWQEPRFEIKPPGVIQRWSVQITGFLLPPIGVEGGRQEKAFMGIQVGVGMGTECMTGSQDESFETLW